MKLVLTCEHGGYYIPKKYTRLFVDSELVLTSHRGYDIGALNVFKSLKPLANFSKYAITNRLLIELNRSLHHPNLFSEFSKLIPKEEKQHLIKYFYLSYRNTVETQIKNFISHNSTVLHLSVHSFTPILNTIERHCDIGLLFDTSSKNEKAFCITLKKELKRLNPMLNVRFNYPYLGKADGFTSFLRKQFTTNYMGIEIEINQKYATNNRMDNQLKKVLFTALKRSLSA